MVSVNGTLLNMGTIGLATWCYVLAVGGDFNGPVLGGIFTAIGFAAFGKHPRNSWPVVTGVVAACLVFGKELAAPGPLLAALFCLTLVPIAGEFGWKAGVIAGFSAPGNGGAPPAPGTWESTFTTTASPGDSRQP